jgi:hypothetical protein
MEFVLILSVIAVIFLITYMVYRIRSSWSVIHEDSNGGEEASEQYAILKNEGIRCRLKEMAPAHTNQSVGMAMNSSAQEPLKFRLEVHKDDLDKAKKLLSNYSHRVEFKL